MKNITGRTYTKDFYLACVIRASGIPLEGLKRQDSQFAEFVFEDPEYDAERVVGEYWNHEISVDAKVFVDTINELKTRLHSGEGR